MFSRSGEVLDIIKVSSGVLEKVLGILENVLVLEEFLWLLENVLDFLESSWREL